jgi:hypothetical protein
MATAPRFKVLGINQDAAFCQCCNKQDIQRVVWIEDTETGEIKHFGTVCAVKPAKGFDCVKEIKEQIKKLDYFLKMFAAYDFKNYREAGGKMIQVADGVKPENMTLFTEVKAANVAKAYAASIK